jgi:3-(3-hydroxy-phenyl)propionate hydroxylase
VPLVTGRHRTWLIDLLDGNFNGVYFAGAEPVSPAAEAALKSIAGLPVPVRSLVVAGQADMAAGNPSRCLDIEGLLQLRFDATPGAFYLFRPDQHLAARWRRLDAPAVRHALDRATANDVISEAAA